MLEVCIDSVESAINAIRGGADELEICSSLPEGGLTPSIGLVKQILCLKKNGADQPLQEEVTAQGLTHGLLQNVKLNVMIRCRAGSDFCYSETEMKTMLADLATIKALGVDRFVFGALTDTQEVDEEKCALAVLAAYPLPLTFHRAIDVCQNPVLSMVKIIKLGFNRVLTSGQRPTVGDEQAYKCISDWMGLYKNKIEIMPGAGISVDNVGKYIQLGCHIVHSSCKAVRNLPMVKNNLSMGTGTTESICYTDESNVVKLKLVIKKQQSYL